MQEPTLSDMSITDEHILVAPKTTIGDIGDRMADNPNNAVLVQNKSGAVQGVVTARDIFFLMADGTNPVKTKLEKIMRTNIATMPGNMALNKALEQMSIEKPDAIVITGPDGGYIGYFSAEDYRDATRKLESHQMMSARLNRSKKAISSAAADADQGDSTTDLLDLLLGDREDEEDGPDNLGTISL